MQRFQAQSLWQPIGALVVLCVLSAALQMSAVGQRMDRLINDLFWTLGAGERVDPRFVFVDIDERALETVGAWPWPRETQAALIEATQAAGANEVTLDVLFSEPRSGDAALASVLGGEQPVVSAMTFALAGSESVRTGVLPAPLTTDGSLCAGSPVFPRAVGYLGSASTLGQPVAGHVTPRTDADGVVRATPAVICFEGQAYPSLALAAYLSATQASGSLQLVSGEGLFAPPYWLRVGEFERFPLSENGELLVPFDQRIDGTRRVSASEVLEGRVSLDGAWAVIGSSAVGLADRIATPLSPLQSGATIHVRLLRGLLDQSLPYPVAFANLVGMALALVAGAAMLGYALFGTLRWWMAPLAVTAVGGAMTAAAFVMQLSAGLLVALSGPLTLLVASSVVATAAAVAKFREDRMRLVRRLSAYLPHEFAERIARGYRSTSVDVSRQDAVLMAVDLRNFDLWSERLDAGLSAALLHHYVCAVTERVAEFGGTVIQVNGTRIHAVWGLDVFPRRVVGAAERLLAEVDDSFPDLEVDERLPPMALSIAIEQGAVLMGTYGSDAARGFSVLGQTAGIVQGLLRMTTELSSPCLMGPVFAGRAGHTVSDSIGIFVLEESTTPTELFALSSAA